MSKQKTTNCQNILECLGDYLDGEIPAALKKDLEDHIQDCHRCKIVVDTTRKTISLYHQHGEDQAVPGPVVDRLLHTLHLDDYYPEK